MSLRVTLQRGEEYREMILNRDLKVTGLPRGRADSAVKAEGTGLIPGRPEDYGQVRPLVRPPSYGLLNKPD